MSLKGQKIGTFSLSAFSIWFSTFITMDFAIVVEVLVWAGCIDDPILLVRQIQCYGKCIILIEAMISRSWTRVYSCYVRRPQPLSLTSQHLSLGSSPVINNKLFWLQKWPLRGKYCEPQILQSLSVFLTISFIISKNSGKLISLSMFLSALLTISDNCLWNVYLDAPEFWSGSRFFKISFSLSFLTVSCEVLSPSLGHKDAEKNNIVFYVE